MKNETKQNPLIDILLSTFNGERYLGDLIESLLRQTYKEWRLLVRDDGSSDATLKIIKNYSIRFPEKIIVLEDDGKRLGACQSFASLLSHSTADYTMFCDQDDVWLLEKVEKSLKKMQELESEYESRPILVHTDMTVVDHHLTTISDSFWKYQHLDPKLDRLNHLLLLNNVTGCTMMINRKLRNISMPIPGNAIVHDWWVVLVASAFGRIGVCAAPSILYRQHGSNQIGADKYSAKYFVSRIRNLNKSINLLKKIVEQSSSFLTIYKDNLSDDQVKVLYNFSNIFKKGRLGRLFILVKFKISGTGFLRNLGIIMFILLMKKTRNPS
jgi:glycosyltransferase involved in cell wall biosynthesis